MSDESIAVALPVAIGCALIGWISYKALKGK